MISLDIDLTRLLCGWLKETQYDIQNTWKLRNIIFGQIVRSSLAGNEFRKKLYVIA